MAEDNQEVTEEQEEDAPKKRGRPAKTQEQKDQDEFMGYLEHVFENEGGLADVKEDRGGLTKFGVTIKTLGDYLGRPAERDEVIDMTMDTASIIYQNMYWKPSRAAQLQKELRMTYLDMCINHGQRNAVRILQKAINRKSRGGIPIVDVDGFIGKNTIKYAKKVDADSLRAERMLFFANLVTKRPKQMRFWLGWYRRCVST